MRLYKSRKPFKVFITGILMPVLLFAVIIALFISGVNTASASAEKESLRITQQAIKKAMVNCYAIEGAYPQNIEYLEQHYGVLIDHEKYIVTYETMGSNIIPYVELVPKGTDAVSGQIF